MAGTRNMNPKECKNAFQLNVLNPQVIHVDQKTVNLEFSVTDRYPLRRLNTKIIFNR